MYSKKAIQFCFHFLHHWVFKMSIGINYQGLKYLGHYVQYRKYNKPRIDRL